MFNPTVLGNACPRQGSKPGRRAFRGAGHNLMSLPPATLLRANAGAPPLTHADMVLRDGGRFLMGSESKDAFATDGCKLRVH